MEEKRTLISHTILRPIFYNIHSTKR